MNIPFAVSQLLIKHDCVIVPRLGGFIAHYEEAKIDYSSMEISPPSKTIAFNKNLLHNDGLLEEYLCESLNITSVESQKMINNFVDDLYKQLEVDKVVEFDKLGEFTFSNKKLVFHYSSKTNLLASSFGLASFSCSALHESHRAKLKAPKKHSFDKAKEKKRNRPVLKLTMAAVLVGLLFLTGLYFDFFQIQHEDSSVMQVASRAKFNNVVDIKNSFVIKTISDAVSDSSKIEKDYPLTVSKQYHHDTKEYLSNKNYHVIAGSFSSESNADKLKNELANMGYNSQIIPAENDMLRVSVISYSIKDEALDNLSRLRQELNNQDLWVVKY